MRNLSTSFFTTSDLLLLEKAYDDFEMSTSCTKLLGIVEGMRRFGRPSTSSVLITSTENMNKMFEVTSQCIVSI